MHSVTNDHLLFGVCVCDETTKIRFGVQLIVNTAAYTSDECVNGKYSKNGKKRKFLHRNYLSSPVVMVVDNCSHSAMDAMSTLYRYERPTWCFASCIHHNIIPAHGTKRIDISSLLDYKTMNKNNINTIKNRDPGNLDEKDGKNEMKMRQQHQPQCRRLWWEEEEEEEQKKKNGTNKKNNPENV